MLKLCANDILQGLKQAITGVVTISASLAVLVLFFKPIPGGTLLPTIPCSFFFLSIIIMATSLFNRKLRDEYRKAHKRYFIERNLLATFKIPGKDKVTGRKLEKFSTESPTFNKLLRAYAEDSFEAFYLLAPKTIATLENITAEHSSGIAFLFVNNQSIIGLSNGKDSFESPRPFRPH